jgi:hypothetical protein
MNEIMILARWLASKTVKAEWKARGRRGESRKKSRMFGSRAVAITRIIAGTSHATRGIDFIVFAEDSKPVARGFSDTAYSSRFNMSGSLAMFDATRLASSIVICFASMASSSVARP